MNQFDKSKVISFELGNVESMKTALNAYRQLLDDNLAFTHGLFGMFDVEFQAKTGEGLRRLQVSDVADQELLKLALSFGSEDTYFTDEITDQTEVYISEPIFFALALKHLELKAPIVETAKAMVALMRERNDTDAVWVDDMNIFGIEALFMVAYTYPEYAYLVGQYMIPYWDSEHLSGYEKFLYTLVEKYGWSRDMIKAYIWCDNKHFRIHMDTLVDQWNEDYTALLDTSLPSLLNHLKANPAEYEWFKQEILERFKQEPVLMYSREERIEEQNPVLDLYITLLASEDYYDEEEEEYQQDLQTFFITDTLENEAMDLQEYVEVKVGSPLLRYDESAQLEIQMSEFFKKDSYKGDGVRDLKEFILALDRGEQLWKYIEQGDNPEVLEDIVKTELLPIAKQHARNFYYQMFYYLNKIDPESEINDALDSILNSVIYDLLNEDDEQEDQQYTGNFISRIISRKTSKKETTEESVTSSEEMFLRILDVFYRLLGVKKLGKGIEEVLTAEEDEEENVLLTKEEFYTRYSKKGAKAANKKEKKLKLSSFGITGYTNDNDALKYVNKVIKHRGREAYDCTGWNKGKVGAITLAAYLLSLDRANMHFDDYTGALLEFVKEGPWEKAYQVLKDSMDTDRITKEEKKFIKDYFVNPNTPEASQEQVVTLLEKSLYREECYRGPFIFNAISEYQKSYSLFKRGDSFQSFVLCAYWLRGLMPPISVHADRIFKLLVALAPQRVFKLIGKVYSDDMSVIAFDDYQAGERFYEDLKRAKVPVDQLYAFQMTQAQSKHSISDPCDVAEYLTWLDLYEEIDSEDGGMIGGARKNKAIALDKGMYYIHEHERIKFFVNLALRHPRFTFDQPESFDRCMKTFFSINSSSRDQAIIDELIQRFRDYMSGTFTLEDMLALMKKDISVFDLDTGSPKYKMTSIGQHYWSLDREKQERLMKLLLNHTPDGFEIAEEYLNYAYVRSLVESKQERIEDYLAFSDEMNSRLMDLAEENAPRMLLENLLPFETDTNHWLSFLLRHEGIEAYQEQVVEFIKQGALPAFLPNSGVKQRIKLVVLIKQHEELASYLALFADDESRKVRAYLN
ncbi:MAG: hypothetical protein ACTJGD_03170 [Mesonia hippocampi]|uniref:hypothetical protein n=1 Tax=Mesonia hippocampi TaxID=1628250 RepID=UPI003F956E58